VLINLLKSNGEIKMKKTLTEELKGLQEAYEEAIGTPVDEAKAKTWDELRDKWFRVFLQTTVTVKAKDLADAEWWVLYHFQKKKPKIKGMTIEKFSVDAVDEL
jgi:hypothetical protein